MEINIERLQLERDTAVEGFKGQFELASKAIKENDELRVKLQKAIKMLSIISDVTNDNEIYWYCRDTINEITK